MKKLISLLLCLFLLNSINTIAMQEIITYQEATKDHTTSIVNLINDHAAKDNDKIVILPKKFRQFAIEENILHKKLYCATTQNNEVIAFKKLYIIDDQKEFENIIYNEIRCSGDKSEFVKSVAFTPNNTPEKLLFDINIPFSLENGVIIYNGNDYTKESHRGQRINSLLMNYALDSKVNDVKQIIIDHKKLNYIVLMYGLTQFNAGQNGGINRTPSIVNAFRKFVNKVSPDNINNIIHKSYHSFMPTFDPEDEECKPLPDKHSIPGYGNILIFPL